MLRRAAAAMMLAMAGSAFSGGMAVAAPALAQPTVAQANDALPGLEQGNHSFARFVRYGHDSAVAASSGALVASAMLSDPVALDGRRYACRPGEKLVALIDLDPRGSLFAPPADPALDPGIAPGLAKLREAGVVVAWLSDLPLDRAGSLRSVLEASGLDPRGQDIISLQTDPDNTKQLRKTTLGAAACIIAIAGDERADFDERYRYLRDPRAGAKLDLLIDNGWFLIEPIF